MTTPRLAIAALTMAICRGVTRTSYWPMADWASCGGFSLSGTELGLTRLGTRSMSPKPNLAAWVRRASAPSLSPRPPKLLLQDRCRATVSVDCPPGPQGSPSSVGRSVVVSGRSRLAGPGTTESSVYLPEDRAAAAVTSLKVEPGG